MATKKHKKWTESPEFRIVRLHNLVVPYKNVQICDSGIKKEFLVTTGIFYTLFLLTLLLQFINKLQFCFVPHSSALPQFVLVTGHYGPGTLRTMVITDRILW